MKLLTILLLFICLTSTGQTMLTTKTKVTIKDEVQVITNNFNGISEWLRERSTFYKMNNDTITAKVFSRLNRILWDSHREFKRSLTKIDTIIVEVDSINIERIVKEYPAEIIKWKIKMKKDSIDGTPKMYQEKINMLQNVLNDAKKARKNWIHKLK